jgi:hypothetical protein
MSYSEDSITKRELAIGSIILTVLFVLIGVCIYIDNKSNEVYNTCLENQLKILDKVKIISGDTSLNIRFDIMYLPECRR